MKPPALPVPTDPSNGDDAQPCFDAADGRRLRYSEVPQARPAAC